MKKGKKGYLEISFGWLFAIIAGAVILFLAIFLVTKLVSVEQTAVGAKTSKEIGILLNPLETSFETAKTTSFTLPTETRIYNKCENASEFEVFGKQTIQLSQKSFNQWKKTDIDVSFENKYFFSDKEIEGKKFYVFSKPFDFPFKVADLIYLIPEPKKYCFISPPEEIEEEICNLNQDNIILVGEQNCLNENIENDCPEGSINICFGSYSEVNCDAIVGSDYVEKNNEELYFEGEALMYGAIFSSPEVYECQVKRLMKRTEQLTLLYNEKGEIISRRGCDFDLGAELISLSNSVSDLTDLSLLSQIKNDIDNIETKNELADCRLW